MATKLRALYQRLKGRDLYDLFLGITHLNMNCEKVIHGFLQYNQHHGISISRAEFEENLYRKMEDKTFKSDMELLLPLEGNWVIEDAFRTILQHLIVLLPGSSSKLPLKLKRKSIDYQIL